jgi:hypothetical protein
MLKHLSVLVHVCPAGSEEGRERGGKEGRIGGKGRIGKAGEDR